MRLLVHVAMLLQVPGISGVICPPETPFDNTASDHFDNAAPNDVCAGKRCDTSACPCGCECGTASDPGACFDPEDGGKRIVLVTGATGRTGSGLYKMLRSDTSYRVRAFVRSASKAKSVLGCKRCDESEGIFIGTLNDTAALTRAAAGASVAAIAAGLSGKEPASLGKAVEYANCG